MAYIFFFKCSSCDIYIVLSEGSSGWIDSEGNLGRAVIDGTILGDPKGESHFITYDTMLCIECGKVYHSLGENTHGIDVKPEQFMEETKWNISVLVGKEICPKCNIKLKHGREVLNLVSNREKCWCKFELDPDFKEQEALKCPDCKDGLLIYDQFWRAD